MMKNLWKWIVNNSSALQGVAALLVIITTLYAGFVVISNFLKPDLLIQLDTNNSTMPEGLLDWIHSARVVLMANKDSLLSKNLSSEIFSEEMNKAFDPSIYSRLSGLRSLNEKSFGRLGITVINQTEEIVSGVRLRVDGTDYFWDLAIKGTFLTQQEITQFLRDVEPLRDHKYLVLPQLPSLPPKSTLEIIFYGSVEFADVAATLPGKTVNVQKLTKVEKSWLIDLYQNPYELLLVVPPVLILLFLIMPLIGVKIVNRIVQKNTPNILYNLACEKALAGDADQAIVLLESAFKKGYLNKAHAMKDPDLNSLQDRPDFKRLFSAGRIVKT